MGIDSSNVEVTHAGHSTLVAEVTQIDKQGIWVLIGGNESFLSFEDFPWFRNAPVSAVHNLELLSTRHLHWPDLDIALAVESIEHPTQFSLIAKSD